MSIKVCIYVYSITSHYLEHTLCLYVWKKDFSYDAKRFSNCVQQKILIRVTMTDDKTRAKAMKTAAQFKGVSAVEIKGDHRNQIEVTGVEVNMICLTNTLRKKVAFAELVSVNKVEPPKKEDDKKKECKKPDEKKPDEKKADEKKTDEKKPEPCCCNPCYQPWPYGYGVPSSFPNPCDPYGYNFRDYTGEPFYNYGPNWRFM
ncbi:unnamed protein product [Brassica rapa subsp. trilocularis]